MKAFSKTMNAHIIARKALESNKCLLVFGLAAMLLFTALFSGCTPGSTSGPSFSVVTFVPEATDQPVYTAAQTELPAEPSKTDAPETTETPDPTPAPTERPPVDSLKFSDVRSGENGSVTSLVWFGPDAEEGNEGHVLANLFDGETLTFWSVFNGNLDKTLDINFSVPVYLNRLENWWHTLGKIYFYEIEAKVAGSDEFIRIIDRTDNDMSDQCIDNFELGRIETLRYHYYDNSMFNKWVQMSEIFMRGMAFSSDTYEIDYVNRIIKIPEETDMNTFFDNLTFTGTFRARVGFMPDSAGTVTDASVLRVEIGAGNNKAQDDYIIEYMTAGRMLTEDEQADLS